MAYLTIYCKYIVNVQYKMYLFKWHILFADKFTLNKLYMSQRNFGEIGKYSRRPLRRNEKQFNISSEMIALEFK